MKGDFEAGSPIMSALSRLADMVILNLLTVLLCIPVFTAGAALTADYYCCLKIRRDEDSGLVKLFFKSFRENLRQSTILWLIMLIIASIPCLILSYINFKYADTAPMNIKIVLAGVVIFILFLFAMVFPVQSRFSNSIGKTIKTAVVLGATRPIRTLLIMLVTFAPFALVFYFKFLVPIIFLCGISVPAFISVLLYNSIFLEMEEKTYEVLGVPEAGSEDEHIFADTDAEDRGEE